MSIYHDAVMLLPMNQLETAIGKDGEPSVIYMSLVRVVLSFAITSPGIRQNTHPPDSRIASDGDGCKMEL